MEVTAPPAFDTIAREYTPALLRYLQRQTGDYAVAQDLLQETLLGIARGLEGFEHRASIKTWVFAIASRVVANHLRQPARARQFVDIETLPDMDDGEVSVEDRLVFDEMNQCVREVIDSLPPDYRSALILHDLEDMDCAQTASVLGISPGAARVRIHRARSRLKAALSRQCGFYRDQENILRCERQD